VRLAVTTLDEVLGGRLDPGRLDCSHHARVQTRRLHQIRRNHPLGWLRGQRRARCNHEARTACAFVFATLVERADVAEESAEDRLVQVVVFGG
jgi:hypothetical protein